MAHFAEIINGIVHRVLIVPDSEQDRGNQYLAVDLLLGGEWVQCSYSGSIRKQFPGAGYSYDLATDVFVAPQPFLSWTLSSSQDWIAPVQKPKGECWWDEDKQEWVKC